MGRNKSTAASTKKGAASGSKRPRHFDANRFVSAEAQDKYEDWFMPKRVIPERKISLELPEDSPILATIQRRNWRTLVTFPVNSPSTILKEFCANAADDPQVKSTRKSWVRGKEVCFNWRTIEAFLNTTYREAEPCEFIEHYNKLQYTVSRVVYREDMVEIADSLKDRIAREHSVWKPKQYRSDLPEKLERSDLTGEASFWYGFINSTIIPSANTTDVNLERVTLLAMLMGGENLNIARILSDRILHIITDGRADTRLAHSSLILQLCLTAGVDIPSGEPYDVRPAPTLVQRNYISLCHDADRAAAIRAANLQVPHVPQVPHAPTMTQPSTSQRPGHVLLYEDSPSYMEMQTQVTYSMHMMEHMCRHMHLDTTPYRPYGAPHFTYPAPEDPETSHAAGADTMEEEEE